MLRKFDILLIVETSPVYLLSAIKKVAVGVYRQKRVRINKTSICQGTRPPARVEGGRQSLRQAVLTTWQVSAEQTGSSRLKFSVFLVKLEAMRNSLAEGKYNHTRAFPPSGLPKPGPNPAGTGPRSERVNP